LFDSLKRGEFTWGPHQLKAFTLIKQTLCSALVLAPILSYSVMPVTVALEQS
jgi:antibiotic biosynthesis monooxygenase (ABM) superfamily enzyme